jgi:predicted secreted protein
MKSYIKQIKSVTTKDELQKITYNAFCSDDITKKQYDKIVANAVCREIELGIWQYLNRYPDKEIALKEAQKQFGIKY